MAEDPRRFDDLVRTVAEMRRRQEDTRSTVLARLGSLTPGGGGGVTDHGALTGLGDDDHPHYYNTARGDARWALVGHNHSGVYAPTSHTHAQGDVTGLVTDLAGKLPLAGGTLTGPVTSATTNFFDLQASHKAAADSVNRHEVYADGYTKWGTGAAALDTVLYRQGSGHLRTDGRFEAATMTVGGTDLATQLSGKVATGDARVTADQAAGTASIRTLGTGAVQAAAGNHSHAPLDAGHEARYYQGAGQSVPNTTDYKLFFDSSEYTSTDITRTLGTATTGSSFTLARDGLWLITVTARFPGGGSSSERVLFIGDNVATGPPTVRWGMNGAQGNAAITLQATAQMRFSAGAVVAAYVWQASGGALVLDAAGRGTHIALTWLRP